MKSRIVYFLVLFAFSSCIDFPDLNPDTPQGPDLKILEINQWHNDDLEGQIEIDLDDDGTNDLVLLTYYSDENLPYRIFSFYYNNYYESFPAIIVNPSNIETKFAKPLRARDFKGSPSILGTTAIKSVLEHGGVKSCNDCSENKNEYFAFYFYIGNEKHYGWLEFSYFNKNFYYRRIAYNKSPNDIRLWHSNY